eukprot:6161486-Prymnesium_polylepis.1
MRGESADAAVPGPAARRLLLRGRRAAGVPLPQQPRPPGGGARADGRRGGAAAVGARGAALGLGRDPLGARAAAGALPLHAARYATQAAVQAVP